MDAVRRFAWLVLLATACGGGAQGVSFDGGGGAVDGPATASDAHGFLGDAPLTADAQRTDAAPEDAADAAADNIVSVADAGPDVSPTPDGGADVLVLADGGIGTPCQNNSQCPVECFAGTCGALCLMGSGFTGGYCTERIAECPAPGSMEVCPAGSSCANGAGDYCLANCNSDANCRTSEGYKCCPHLAPLGPMVCAPAAYCP